MFDEFFPKEAAPALKKAIRLASPHGLESHRPKETRGLELSPRRGLD
jgi:hypothetical protein